MLLQDSGQVKNIALCLITTQVCFLLQAVVSPKKEKSVLKQLVQNKPENNSEELT